MRQMERREDKEDAKEASQAAKTRTVLLSALTEHATSLGPMSPQSLSLTHYSPCNRVWYFQMLFYQKGGKWSSLQPSHP